MRQWRATGILIAVLAFVAVLSGINFFTRPFDQPQPATDLEQVTPAPAMTTESLDPVTEQVERMSDVELVWQTLAYPMVLDEAVGAEASTSALPATPSGSIVLFGTDIASESAQALVAQAKQQYTSDQTFPWIAIDHEGGLVQRIGGKNIPDFDSLREFCTVSAQEQADQAASAAAALAAYNINVVFGPVVDVATSSGLPSSRFCSNDPEEVASAAAVFIQAYQHQNILPVIKHYPGIGGVRVDLHNQFGFATITKQAVQPFHDLLQKYPVLGVMTAHAGVEKDRPIACSRDTECVQELVTLYPKAIVFSDALEMQAARYSPESKTYDTPLPVVALESLMAGNDVLVFGPKVSAADMQTVADFLLFSASQDENVRMRLKESVQKIVSYKQTMQQLR